MNVPVLSNNLASAAETIKENLAEAANAARTSAEKSIEAGHALFAAKAVCKHGQWLPFLERAGVHERQARRLMQLAEAGLKSDTVSDLGGVKSALDFTSKRQRALKTLGSMEYDGWVHVLNTDGTVNKDAAAAVDSEVLDRDIDRLVTAIDLMTAMKSMYSEGAAERPLL